MSWPCTVVSHLQHAWDCGFKRGSVEIAVTSATFSNNEVLKRELLQFFPDCRFNDAGTKLDGARLLDFIGNADGLIVALENFTHEVISRLSRVKVISKFGVGLDNIDLEYCKQRGIYVGWTAGVNKLSVAEMTVGFMIMLRRNLFISSAMLKNGSWVKNGGMNLSGEKVGVIGVGNIGKELIRLLRPFSCDIFVNDIVDQDEYYRKNKLTEVSKEHLFRNSDIVTLHVPLTDETKYLINRKCLETMKPESILINTSRGPVVNTNDLKWALINKIIFGAALDVYEEEPPEDKEFLNLPNLVCTPHIGGNSVESVLAMGRAAIGHLREHLDTLKINER